jgi:hypothetical protein
MVWGIKIMKYAGSEALAATASIHTNNRVIHAVMVWSIEK